MKTRKIELSESELHLIAIALLGEMNKITAEAIKELKNDNMDEYNELMRKSAEYTALYFDEFSVEKCTL